MSDKPEKLKIDIPEYNYIILENNNKTPIFNRQIKYSKSFEFWKDFDENENKINLDHSKKNKN